MVTGKNSMYKLFWMGNQTGIGGVGVFVAQKWIDNVFDVSRISDRIIVMKLCTDKVILSIVSVYAPQVGLDSSSKDDFYDNLHSVMVKISDQETVIIGGDFNGHIK